MNAESQTIWGLPVVIVESMDPCEVILVSDRHVIREDADLIEEDGRWVVRLRGVGA